MEAPLNILLAPKRIAKSTIAVHLTIDGEPVSKQRPRMAVTKGGHVYTPAGTKQAEAFIGWAIKGAYGAMLPDETSAFGVRLVFYTKSRQRRDIDNMCKLVFDACNGLVWKDDAQVEELIANLVRASDKPRTELAIYTVKSTTPYINCELCNKRVRIYPSWADRRFCSRKCSSLSQQNGRDVPCAHCGVMVHRAAHRSEGKRSAFYCSSTCLTAATSVELLCRQCGATFRKPRSLNRYGHGFCTKACSNDFWRQQRAKTAEGTCGDCGGPTTKKAYQRCRACRLVLVTARPDTPNTLR